MKAEIINNIAEEIIYNTKDDFFDKKSFKPRVFLFYENGEYVGQLEVPVKAMEHQDKLVWVLRTSLKLTGGGPAVAVFVADAKVSLIEAKLGAPEPTKEEILAAGTVPGLIFIAVTVDQQFVVAGKVDFEAREVRLMPATEVANETPDKEGFVHASTPFPDNLHPRTLH